MAADDFSKFYLYLSCLPGRDLLLGLLAEGGQLLTSRVITQGCRTEKLLPALARFVKHNSRLSGIIIGPGSGSFSQDRLMVSLANAWSYAQSLKLAYTTSPCDEVVAVWPDLKWQRVLKPVYNRPAVK